VEGPTDDPEINALRRRQRRNLLTTLFLSQGVPMLCGGDEWGRSQNGNNNAYCQDNELSWFNWERGAEDEQLLQFTMRLIQLRTEHAVLRRPKFFQGRRIRASEIKDVMWFNPGGNEMSEDEWTSPFVRCVAMLLSGDTMDLVSFEGQPVRDQTFLLLINAHYEPIEFVLPGSEKLEWEVILDTTEEDGFLKKTKTLASGDDFEVANRSTCLFRLVGGAQAQARQESWKKRHFGLPEAVTAKEERVVRKKPADKRPK
jgi:glycogen operon protein